MGYVPTTDQTWESIDATAAGFDAAGLAAVIAFAEAHETPWPYDLEKAGNVPGLSQFEKAPWDEALGVFKPRGGANGLLLKGGRLVARWREWPEATAISWALGVALLVHSMSFISISYWGQIHMIWYLLLAMIGSLAPLGQSAAHESSKTHHIRPAGSLGATA